MSAGESALLTPLRLQFLPPRIKPFHIPLGIFQGMARFGEGEVARGGGVFDKGGALGDEGLGGLGRTQEATQELTAARESFASFGAGPLTAEADEWLARATALSS